MDGWGYLDNKGCIYYGQLRVENIESYLPSRRSVNDAVAVLVKAKAVASDVELWAKEASVQAQFEEIRNFQDGVALDLYVFQKNGKW
jgi:hypothetical protein